MSLWAHESLQVLIIQRVLKGMGASGSLIFCATAHLQGLSALPWSQGPEQAGPSPSRMEAMKLLLLPALRSEAGWPAGRGALQQLQAQCASVWLLALLQHAPAFHERIGHCCTVHCTVLSNICLADASKVKYGQLCHQECIWMCPNCRATYSRPAGTAL